MKPGPAIGICVIVAAMAYGAYSFKNSLIAYVPFQQAVAAGASGQNVQIIGAPVAGATHYDIGSATLDFRLREAGTGRIMPVVFRSPKPDNFDAAVKVTAIGHYSAAARSFLADNLLVKCPSKYNSADRTYKSGTRASGVRIGG